MSIHARTISSVDARSFRFAAIQRRIAALAEHSENTIERSSGCETAPTTHAAKGEYEKRNAYFQPPRTACDSEDNLAAYSFPDASILRSLSERINVGFAALTMNKDIGLTSQMFGFGAGIFFLGYFVFEVPSTMILHKVGARFWIGRVMITWGFVSVAMAFIQGPLASMPEISARPR